MKVTVIVSVYKDTEALELILQSLLTQSYKDFDILISDDCESDEMKKFMFKYSSYGNISHISQADDGWRKNIALNNAVRTAQGDYLIFLDGDIVPYKNFVEHHVNLAEKNRFLSGRRVELGPVFSKLIRKKILTYRFVQKFYLFLLPLIVLDKGRHVEEGIYLKPDSKLERKINGKKKKYMMLVGCNFSCWKKDLETINGFDEDYKSPSVGEDVDLAWRFNLIGVNYKSVRYIANAFHLYHERDWGDAQEENELMMKSKRDKKLYRCKNGLVKES